MTGIKGGLFKQSKIDKKKFESNYDRIFGNSGINSKSDPIDNKEIFDKINSFINKEYPNNNFNIYMDMDKIVIELN